MPEEADVVAMAAEPLTVDSLSDQLRQLGVYEGQVLLVHSSLSSLGWVVGGPVAVVEALLKAVGPAGTLVMPSHTGDNSDPSHWGAPAVPESWWPAIRASMPPFDRAKTPTRGMGKVAEAFRSWPGVIRSYHPTTSFCALGPVAEEITRGHDLADGLGDRSPLGRLYDLAAHVLLLAVGHGSNTSLHLAEARASWPGRRYVQDGSAVLEGGERRWVEYSHLDWSADDFPRLGLAFEEEAGVAVESVGCGESRLFPQVALVDFAVGWMEAHRRPGSDRLRDASRGDD